MVFNIGIEEEKKSITICESFMGQVTFFPVVIVSGTDFISSTRLRKNLSKELTVSGP